MDDDVLVNSTTTTTAIASSSSLSQRPPRKSVFLGVFALSRPGSYDAAQAKYKAKQKAEKQQKQELARARAKQTTFASQRLHVKRKHDAGDDTDSTSSRESSFDAAGLVATAGPHSREGTPARSTSKPSTSQSPHSSNVRKKIKPSSPSASNNSVCILQGDERARGSPRPSNVNSSAANNDVPTGFTTDLHKTEAVRSNSLSFQANAGQEGYKMHARIDFSAEQVEMAADGPNLLSPTVQEVASCSQGSPPNMRENQGEDRREYSATPELPSPPPSKPRKKLGASPSTALKPPIRTIVISDSDSSEEEQTTGAAKDAGISSKAKAIDDSEEEQQPRLQQSSKYHQPSSTRKPLTARCAQSLSVSEESEEDPDITISHYAIKDNSDDSDYSDSDQTMRERKKHIEAKAHSRGITEQARGRSGRGKETMHASSAYGQRAGFPGRPSKRRAQTAVRDAVDLDGQESVLPAVSAERPQAELAKRKAPRAKRSGPAPAGTQRESRSHTTVTTMGRYPTKNTRSQTAAGTASSSLLCHQCEVYHERNRILHCISCERGMCSACLVDRYHAYPTYAAHLLYMQTFGADSVSRPLLSNPRKKQKSRSAGLERQGSSTSSAERHPPSEDSDADIPLITATNLHDTHTDTHNSTLSSSNVGKDTEAGINLLDFQCPVCKAVCNCANCLRGPYPKPETILCKPTEAERLAAASTFQNGRGLVRKTKAVQLESVPELSSEDDDESSIGSLHRQETSRARRNPPASAGRLDSNKRTRPRSSDLGLLRTRVRLKITGPTSTANGEPMSAIERAEARRAAIDAETDYVPVVAARAAPKAASSECSNVVPRFGSPPQHRYSSASDVPESQATSLSQAVSTSTSGRVRLATRVGQQLGKSPASMLHAAASAVPRIEGDQLIPFNSHEPIFTLPSQTPSIASMTGISLQGGRDHDPSTMSFPFKHTLAESIEAECEDETVSEISTEAVGTLPDLVYQTGDDEQTTPSIPSPAEDMQPQPMSLPLQLYELVEISQQPPAFTFNDALSVPLTLPHCPEAVFDDFPSHKSVIESTLSDKLYSPDYFDTVALKSYIDDEAMSGYLNFAAFDDSMKQD